MFAPKPSFVRVLGVVSLSALIGCGGSPDQEPATTAADPAAPVSGSPPPATPAVSPVDTAITPVPDAENVQPQEPSTEPAVAEAPAEPAPPTQPSAPATPTPPAAEPADEPAAAPAGPSPEQIAEGQQLYASAGNCTVCHGSAAQGGPLGPNLTDDEWIWVEADQPIVPQLMAVIREGVPQPREHPAPMLPMGGANLTEAQIEAIAVYIASL